MIIIDHTETSFTINELQVVQLSAVHVSRGSSLQQRARQKAFLS